jgi:hypothetical protein
MYAVTGMERSGRSVDDLGVAMNVDEHLPVPPTPATKS